ncbi:VanZ family protein [Aeromicrobium sp. Leaf350]|uniref:VanZ family protein n=1 Tax=Aeromicrobium sp. Leaf350 TaxID=2876565 RepID=UPI001E2A790E|nr:VanZ family protein [Aeromicrobium sp. Leaf350]
MITTILVEHPWLTTAGLGLLVVAGPPLGVLLVRRRRTTQVLLAASLVAIALLTLTPSGSDLGVRCVAEWSWPALGRVELIANAILFVPAVALASLLTRRPVPTLLGASASSVLIEGVQALVTPLGRSCSTNDWLYNTLGALLGAAVAALALHLDRRGEPAAARE